MRRTFTFLFLLLVAPSLSIGDQTVPINTDIWAISETSSDLRWVVIHNLDEASSSGIYHIEVIAREKGKPKWQIKRLAPHLAITEDALRRSILSPLKSGSVYPEPYDDAFKEWQNCTNAFICDTSVIECISKK